MTVEEKYLRLPLFKKLVDTQFDLLKHDEITATNLYESTLMALAKYALWKEQLKH
jgi:hypothetical protein